MEMFVFLFFAKAMSQKLCLYEFMAIARRMLENRETFSNILLHKLLVRGKVSIAGSDLKS